MVRPIPDGYTAVTPYLVVDDAAKLVEFVKNAFGAKVLERMEGPGGLVMHAEVEIGGARVMMGDARGGRWGAIPGMVYLYVPDCDATFRRAIAAGATPLMEPATQFYGDRNGGVKDPFGNFWWIGTHVEDVPPAELRRRAEEQAAAHQAS